MRIRSSIIGGMAAVVALAIAGLGLNLYMQFLRERDRCAIQGRDTYVGHVLSRQ